MSIGPGQLDLGGRPRDPYNGGGSEDFTFGLDLGFRVLIAVLGAA
jgi:hypothetical protein